jgi:hypothetical protein
MIYGSVCSGIAPDNFLEYRRLKIARLQRRIAARVKTEGRSNHGTC